MIASDLGARIAEHLPCLHRYAHALLVRRPDRADDLVQDTVLRALSKAHLWQPGTDLRAWLLTLMHRLHLNGERKTRREDRHLPLEAAYDVSRPALQPEALLLRDLQRTLDRLPVEQRTVVLMVGLGDARYERVAETLNIPLNTMRARLARGRATMRAQMDRSERRQSQLRQASADARACRDVRGRRRGDTMHRPRNRTSPTVVAPSKSAAVGIAVPQR